ncbi:molybdopterin-synthase adenylyltransferase MoeB [Marinomonas agarivorans]|nr:molybdopterin-synthase adenylyltransferase MoeB [Marinomonas agarivorans]
MNDLQLERYSRQILMPDFDIEGQLKLNESNVLVVGLGGLGNIASLYLSAAGVGKLTLVDHDEVELSNLARQVLYSNDNIHMAKVSAAKEQLLKQNPHTQIVAVQEKMTYARLADYIQSADLVLDCTDNFTVRQAINKTCFQTQTNLVTGAGIRWQGQLQSFLFSDQRQICYQCLYPHLDDEMLNCSESGVISPVIGTIGVLQALDAIKILSGCGTVEHGKLRLFDGAQGQWREIRLTQDPQCLICGI